MSLNPWNKDHTNMISLSHSYISLVPSSLVQQKSGLHAKLSLPSDRNPSPIDLTHHGCSCCFKRRSLFIGTTSTFLLPVFQSNALSDYKEVLEKFHPRKPDWYEEFYASVMNTSMKSYEAEIAGYKSELFASMRGKARRVLEIGIGTGPNMSYYADEKDIQVIGVDPNEKMEKYAEASAISAGLPLPNFKFVQAVGEVLPFDDDSVDAIVGTLVLCSVKDVTMALQEVKRVLRPGGLYLFVEHVAAKEGTGLRFVQSALDPLQQAIADGCHLTRETGKLISEAGFSDLNLNMASLSNIPLISPHVYGIAYN